MNLQQLRHFIAIAEELHFGRAAERLHIAQPPLSQSLARLEASLGFMLVSRTRRSVTLTAAGEAFLRELRPAMRQIDRAVLAAAAAHAGHMKKVNVGFVSSAITEALPRMIGAIERAMPETEVVLHELPSNIQLGRLLEGALDIGLSYAHHLGEADILTREVARYALLLAIPAEWPLARKRRVAFTDLAGHPFILFPPELRPDLHAMLNAECERHGFSLQVKHEIGRTRTMIGLVRAGQGMALVDESQALLGYPGVVFKRLDAFPPFLATMRMSLSMAWHRRAATPHYDAIFRHIADALAVGPDA
jgi:DNA-binding transcriptional LysR family regulator